MGTMKFLLAVLSAIQLVSAIDWDLNMCYDNQKSWPVECTRSLQSPIPLSQKIATLNTSLSIRYSPGYWKPTALNVINIGVTWEIKPIINSDLYVIINRREQYYLGAAYLHWPSEHTIEGKRYDLELQLVHHRSDFNSWEAAARTPGGTYVISILFNVTDCDNPDIDPLLQPHDRIYRKPFIPIKTVGTLGNFIPQRDRSYYNYQGSVPIPDCPENVNWHVFTESSFISRKQLNVLTDIYSEKGTKLTRTNRDLNDIKDRTVYFSKDQQC